jgi:hypothetical protein
VSLFVLSPEIEDRDEVEVDNWVKGIKWNFLFAARAIITGGMKRHCSPVVYIYATFCTTQ